MVKKITTILGVFTPALAFILPEEIPTIDSGTFYEFYSHYPKS